MSSALRGRLAARIAVVCVIGVLVACTASPRESKSSESGGPVDSTGIGVSDPSSQAEPDVPSSANSGSIVSDSNDQYSFSQIAMTAGGWVTGIVAHPAEPDVLFARTDVGGAYRWNAATERWEQMITSASLPDRDSGADLYQVESVAVAADDPDIVYLSVGNDQPLEGEDYETDGRVLRSDDRGRTWTSSTSRFFVAGNGAYRQQGERIAVDPARSDVVMLGTRRQGIWISADGGDTFSNVDAAMVPHSPTDPASAKDAGISFVTPDPSAGTTSDGRTARWYAGVGGVGVVRTDDGGETWTSIRSVGPTVVPQEGEVVDGRLYVAFNDPGGQPATVERYAPDETWTVYDLPPEITIWSLTVDPTDGDRIMVATEAVRTGGVYYTQDGGRTWSNPVVTTSAPDAPWIAEANDGGYMPVGKFIFDPHDTDRLWFAEGIGVWTAEMATDFLEWEFAGQGIDELVVADFVAPSGGATVSAVADFQGFVHESLDAVPTSPLVDGRFAGGTSLDYVGGSPEQLVWIGAEYNIYFNPERRSRAARSLDGGTTWEELPNLEPDMFGGNVAVSAGDPDNIVWLPSNLLSSFEHLNIPKGLFATTDAGANWTRLPDVGGTNAFHRLFWWFARQALTADKVAPHTFYLVDDEEHFFVSTSGGTEWTPAKFAPPCTVDSACHVFGQIHGDPMQAERVWAGVGSNGLYRTDDAGRTAWEQVDGVDEVFTFGFGAPIGDASTPAIFFYGRANGDPKPGIWRSADDGATFELVVREPFDSFANINVVEGDMNVPGRVYVGFGGSGAVYGDDASLR
jgi:photosystem II stability/assembly factor-like uncharacterized protein